MGNHPFNVIVVLFWFATMSWLVVAKILPPLRVGEPPNYTAIIEDSVEQPEVCWSIRMHDRTIGWAASKMARRKDGISDFYSRVYIGQFPLDEVAPGWITGVLKNVVAHVRRMDLDKRSTLVVDPLGRLVSFESRLRLGDIPDAIKVSGQVEDSSLKLSLQSGDFPYKIERSLPPNALMGDELSPQARMPGLRLGQTWTVPLYSPFRSPNSPMEILQAVVEREDRISWDGQSVRCHVVVYRGDSGAGSSGDEVRGRVWVRNDGVVLRQEVVLLNTHIHFILMGREDSEPILHQLGADWTAPLPRSKAQALLKNLCLNEL